MSLVLEQHKPASKKEALLATVDLRNWLPRCQAADVPYIPARICPFQADTRAIIEGHLDELVPIEEWTTETWIREGEPKHIWRWTLCAPFPIKAAMSHPRLPVWLGSPLEHIQDERFRKILADCSNAGIDKVTTVIRPWTQAATDADFPVEFRVFVTPEGTTSTTSYYTQRRLSKAWLPYAKTATGLAKRLRPFVPEKICYAADFLVTENKQVLFIEGGPPPEFGGDPCLLDSKDIGSGEIRL